MKRSHISITRPALLDMAIGLLFILIVPAQVQWMGSPPGEVPAGFSEKIALDSVSNALAYLSTHQGAAGAWHDGSPLALRDTAAVISAYRAANYNGPTLTSGIAWLASQQPAVTDYQARRLTALAGLAQAGDLSADLARLRALRTGLGSWPAAATASAGDAYDTALAAQGDTTQTTALSYLVSQQQADGGWATGGDASTVQGTATALLALGVYRGIYNLAAPISQGLALLQTKAQGDGGYGDGGASNPQDTTLAVLAQRAAGPLASSTTLNAALLYLANSQGGDGSWGGEVYATALAIQALAQAVPPGQGILRGRVTNVSGQPLGGAQALLVGTTVTQTVDAGGVFTFTMVPAGPQQVTVSKPAYISSTVSGMVSASGVSDLGLITLEVPGPAASFSYAPAQPLEGEQYTAYANFVRFTDTSTPLPGTTITERMWRGSDGDSYQNQYSATYPYWDKIFPDNGIYTITLYVRDSLGHIGQVSRPVTVANVPPVVAAGAAASTMAGIPVNFGTYDNPNIGYYTDAGPVDKSYLPFNLWWNFGDGVGKSFALDTGYAYNNPGTYTATLTVVDKDGGVGSSSRVITVVADHPPVAGFSATPAAPLTEASVTRFFDASTDPDPVGDATELEFWGWHFSALEGPAPFLGG